MTSEFHAGNVWPHITAVVRGAGKTYAAISFIGTDALDLLPLGNSDVLVVNASLSAVRSHATNPYILESFLNQGVKVYSSDRLHAKVIATDRHAVIGSANASANSTRSAEAVLITDNRSERISVKAFVEREIHENAFELNQDKLTDLKKSFDDAGAPLTTVPGVNNPHQNTYGFPWHLGPVYLVKSEPADLTSDETQEILQGSNRPTGFELGVTQIDEDVTPFDRGDIVILFDGTKTHAPFYVDSDIIRTKSDEFRRGQIIQQKIKHRRSYVISGMKHRYQHDNESFHDLVEDLERSDGRMELRGQRRDSLLQVWFPEFKAREG